MTCLRPHSSLSEEAVDFEVNFSVGGEYSDWINLIPTRSPGSDLYDTYVNSADNSIKPKMFEYSWDYLNQEFVISMVVPSSLKGAGLDNTLGMYLRPALNSAFRESVWPLDYKDVKLFTGNLVKVIKEEDPDNSGEFVSVLVLSSISGEPKLYYKVCLDGERKGSYAIENVTKNKEKNLYYVRLGVEIEKPGADSPDYSAGDKVYVDLAGKNTPKEQEVSIYIDNDFFNSWANLVKKKCMNSTTRTHEWGHELCNVSQLIKSDDPNKLHIYTPAKHLGFDTNYIEANWIGNNNWNKPVINNWADASYLNSFLDSNYFPKTENGLSMKIISNTESSDYPNGANNFFVAPLIERDYRVNVKIVEE